ncbi:MAG: hypothetical protein ABH871_06185 [Pseudomonadota bacterium]
MRHGFKMKLKPLDGDKLVEGEFNKHGILFLMSNARTLILSPLPDHRALIHAIFLYKKKKVFAASLREGLGLGNDGFVSLSHGAHIDVGSKRLTMIFDKKKRLKRKHWLALALLPLVVFSFALVRHKVTGSPNKKSQIARQQKLADNKSASQLISEAKMHMRAGNADQASLTLMEAMDQNPHNKEAMDLLESINKDAALAKSSINEKEVDLISSAKDMYDEGRQRMQEGDVAGAHDLFSRALKELSEAEITVPFKSALLAAKDNALLMLKQEMAPRLLEAQKLFDAARKKETKEAIDLLAQAYAYASSVAKILPQNDEALSVCNKLRKEIEAVSSRLILSAQAIERFSGCKQALVEYERIASVLKDIDSDAAAVAANEARRCSRSQGGDL